jgi:phosphoribosyl 1,2-cyclic phosphodiesterase/DNA-binding response OmpR family regulator
MRVRFWGTRGSIAKAGPSTTRYGGNTSCVEIRSSRGTLVVLDCGTGAHGLGQALIKNEPRPLNGHLLIGHTHWDHIQGFPFFSPLFVPDNEWHVYGPRGVGSSLRESLSGQMQYTYSPITLDDLGATLHYHDLVEGTLELGDVHVTTQYLNHPALTLGYRLEVDGVTVVYSTDHEPHSRRCAEGNPEPFTGQDSRHAQFLADADLVIHDAQYTAAEYPSKTGWGHSTVEYVVVVAASAGVRRLALFHHDPTRDDDAIDRLVAGARDRAAKAGGGMEVFAAAEGTVLELHGDQAGTSSIGATVESARTDPALISSDHRVLVSVANPLVDRLLSAAVHADGLRLLTLREGNALASLVRSEPLSLVLLQGGLQDGEVLQFCRSLRRDPASRAKYVPIVLVREKESPAEQQREAEAGITDWLIWPFSEPYARTRIRAWVLGEACRWKPAPLPPDEERRLQALWACGVLDTEAEERFDRFTRIAAALFDVPIALVSLVDRDRQWFKSRRGLDARETPRDSAFCAHAILGDDVLQVPDALQDDRFADNPLVTGEPRVRFYAGAPLTLKNGTHAGTLCVMDHRARNLDEGQLQLLRDLAKLVEREFHTSSAAVRE